MTALRRPSQDLADREPRYRWLALGFLALAQSLAQGQRALATWSCTRQPGCGMVADTSSGDLQYHWLTETTIEGAGPLDGHVAAMPQITVSLDGSTAI